MLTLETTKLCQKYSNNTNPDETLTEAHRDFLLYGLKIRTEHPILTNCEQSAKEKSNSISPCPNIITGVMKITQSDFSAIFEL